jgi:hypothetical protein
MSRYKDQTDLLLRTGPTVRPLQGLNEQQRGSSINIPLTQSTPFTTVVNARTESADAEMLCVAIGVVVNGSTIAGASFDLKGLITWGVGGANFQAEIDLVNGLVFNIPANFIRVDVGCDVLSPVATGSFQVSAGVSYGAGYPQTSAPTRRTKIAPAFAGAGPAFADLPVPAFATAFTPWQARLAAGAVGAGVALQPFTIVVSGGTAFPTYEWTTDANTGRQGENTFPLPNGATNIRLITTAAQGFLQAGVIYHLAI